ncbi:hypothetical protein MKW98_016329 [Papaver atlanticum]|uniref:Uncharacterized protein n=1 Tax=Papaver atlanticum TaxID=357466 RepID=A0AAD4SIR3_9MAGN|nr:hypothetical protein MKW98_016329 [Papaver atlanticum]
MVFRKEIQMSGFLFVFLFWVFVLSTDGIGGLSAVDKNIDDNGFSSTLKTCNFPAVFNFGDSNSDTGGHSAAFYAIGTPNGETFFGKPSGRACDGRLIVDFMAEELGLAYLRAYLDSLALSSFKNGANFATGGSPIRKDKGYSPFHLDAQIAQFRQFKARTIDIVNSTQQGKGKADLPKPEDFSKALYTFDIGQNDLQFGLSTPEGARAPIPVILDQFATAVQQLYSEGARVFWVHNTGPIGCLPSNNKYYYGKEPLDKNGCVISLNEIAQEFNRQLKSKLAQLKANLTGAAFTYVDAYTAKYNLINYAKDQGFVDPLDFCCCPEKVVINGTVYGGPCANPLTHISWDGIHYSEAANQWVAKFILNGSMSDTSVPINQACHA